MFAFLLTMTLIFWRPKGINEAIPATLGAILVFLSGSVSITDLGEIGSKVSGAAITIISTMVMALALESFGFFHWVAAKLLIATKNSGIRLFWLTNLLCFLMTLFLNNDGSILITTPILIMAFKNIGLKSHQKIPYLISGAIIATASSAAIGVSNIVNLISLEIIGLDLYLQTAMMFVPATLGLIFLTCLLFITFYNNLPKTIPMNTNQYNQIQFNSLHPLQFKPDKVLLKKQSRFLILVVLFIIFVRISLFVASYFGISISLVSVLCSIVLLGWRWYVLKINPIDMFKKTPWHILVFAFNMYVIIFGLNNIGLTDVLTDFLEPIVSTSLLHASLIMGTLTAVLSNLFNNHPALMIGTLALTDMGLDPLTVKTIYLANIIGSDIGSLLLPIGTLASLIWMHILRQNNVKITWKQYISVTILTIPSAMFFTLICLYYWIKLVFY
ncbi:arsenic transporter [Neobacillus sp. LXY-4]|uniref:arsenic transporter n=1 Tax=Neobacillus sp. LXY-4 TaxID=3379826 RepID=UPI003EE0BB49